MITEPGSRRLPHQGEDGFTLLEVLVAMIILAIGLLGLEALGIGAARALAIAEHNNEMVALATASMEETQREIRTAPGAVVPGETCESLPRYSVCSRIDMGGALPTSTALVTITVVRLGDTGDTYSVRSYVFDPAIP